MQQGYRPTEYAPVRRGKARGRHRGAAVIAVLVLLCAALLGGLYLSAYLAVKPYDAVFADNVYIDGISLAGMTADEGYQAVWEQVNSRQSGWSLALSHNGFTYITLDYATLGVTTDGNQVINALNAAWRRGHAGNVFERRDDIAALKNEPFIAYTSQSQASDEQLSSILDVIAGNLRRAATDAALLYFDPSADEPFVFQNETWGAYLDVDKAKSDIYQMMNDMRSGEYILETTPVAPNVTRAQLEKTVALRATGVTPVATSSTQNRTDNIRVAFSKINGTTLKPGAKFSFNDTVGWRTTANGFLTAPEYAYGELVTGVGGGVCQASTTVYLAAVCAGLKITDRVAHSDPVNYTLLGQDATVYLTRDRKIDFKFQNDSGGTLYMTAKVLPDPASAKRFICQVNIYGPSLGDNVYYRLESTTTKTIPKPIEPEYVKDADGTHVIYTDQQFEVYKAREGYVVETYLQRVENGVMVEETRISTDTYKARPARIYVGTKSR